MILESIVSTRDAAGRINLAPLGPVVDGPELTRFTLRPFSGSRTYDNLIATRSAVIHVTDDAELFACSAIGRVDGADRVVPVDPNNPDGPVRLRHCHRWFEIQITSVGGSSPRWEMDSRVLRSGIVDPCFGFNRGKHAVIEAAILATRIDLFAPADLIDQIDRLRVLVDKTGGPAERRGFETLNRYIRERLQTVDPATATAAS